MNRIALALALLFAACADEPAPSPLDAARAECSDVLATLCDRIVACGGSDAATCAQLAADACSDVVDPLDDLDGDGSSLAGCLDDVDALTCRTTNVTPAPSWPWGSVQPSVEANACVTYFAAQGGS